MIKFFSCDDFVSLVDLEFWDSFKKKKKLLWSTIVSELRVVTTIWIRMNVMGMMQVQGGQSLSWEAYRGDRGCIVEMKRVLT